MQLKRLSYGRSGTMRTTIQDVASKANVSVATVSYVLNEVQNQTISGETSERVRQAAKELNYVSNGAAATLKSGRSGLIAIVLPRQERDGRLMISDPYYAQLISRIEYYARERGYHLLLTGTREPGEYARVVRKRKADGVIALGWYDPDDLAELHEQKTNIVLVDVYAKDKAACQITADDRMSGYLAAKHLIDNGHKAIAFLGKAADKGSAAEKRLQGCKEAMKEAGMTFERRHLYTYGSDGEYGMAAGRKLKDVTAVIAATASATVGLLRGLSETGRKVPEDVSVIALEDDPLLQMSVPAVTGIGQDPDEKARIAVEMVTFPEKYAGSQRVKTLPVSMAMRESVKKLS